MTAPADLLDGARNLLAHCGGLAPGARLLVVHEDPALGWYDEDAAEALEQAARGLGAAPSRIEVGGPEAPPPPGLQDAIDAADAVVFLARIGDRDRFAPRTLQKPVVMSYAREAWALGSAYGRADHRAFLALKAAIDDLLFAAETIHIRCALGTDLTGAVDPALRAEAGEVTVRRFPMGVHRPIPAAGFRGHVALARCLAPTGSRPYAPAALMLEEPALARIADGRILGFDGSPRIVQAIEAHYAHVARLFGLDSCAVHSWHAGLHPASTYHGRFDRDPDHWANTVFTSPRLLHFHTCGAYAPGEICWMVEDPTILVDGRALWADGRLRLDDFAPLRAVQAAWPALAPLFAAAPEPIGLDAAT